MRRGQISWAAATAALAATTAGMLPPNLVGALAVQIGDEFGLTASDLGMIVSGFFLLAGLAAVRVGRMVGRMGWRRAIAVSGAGTAVAMLGIALWGRSWLSLSLLLCVGGLSHSLAVPAGNVALAAEIIPRRRALMFGVKQAAVPAVTILVGLSIPIVVLPHGWRWAFVGALAVPALAGAALLAERRRRPAGSDGVPAPSLATSRGPLGRRSLIWLALAGGLAATVAGAMSSFFVLSSVSAGISEAGAGQLLALGSAIGLGTRVWGGWYADRHPGQGFRLVAIFLLVGSVGFGLFATGEAALVVAGAPLAFGAGWGWPGLFHFAMVDQDVANAARSTGVAQTGLSTGAAAGPLVFGIVADQVSFSGAWLVVTAAALLAGLLILWAGRSHGGAEAPAEASSSPNSFRVTK